MKPESKPCPSCLSTSFQDLVDFGIVPHSGTFLLKQEQKYRSIRLSYEFCLKCALLRRKLFEDDSYDYTSVSRLTGRWAPDYITQIADSFKKKGIEKDALIIDVGANDGSFLDILKKEGFTNLLGVEPSVICAKECEFRGYRVEKVHLNLSSAVKIKKKHGLASVVVCRHTIEHVPNPLDFVKAIRTLLYDDGILFIETPASQEVTHNLHGYELWDEHLHIFTPENLDLLLYRTGFSKDMQQIRHYKGITNILVWAKPNLKSLENKHLLSKASLEVEFCKSFNSRWSDFCKQKMLELKKWKKPIACIGASHPQSNFLIFTNIGKYVSFLIDDDPVKIGKFVPIPKPVPVISTEQLFKGEPPGTIILGAFGYDDWMNKIQKHFISKKVLFVEPYPKK